VVCLLISYFSSSSKKARNEGFNVQTDSLLLTCLLGVIG